MRACHCRREGVLGDDPVEDPAAQHARRARGRRRTSRRCRCRPWPAPCPCSPSRCGRTASARASRAAAPRRRHRSRSSAANAEPEPYQPGSISAALRPAEHPRDGAQVLDAPGAGPRRRPAADVQRRDLADRRDRREELDEPRLVVDERAVGVRASAASVDIVASKRSASAPRSGTAPADASSVAATSVSRLRRAADGWLYLAATISPCSVIRSCPSTEPGGWARIASYAGPPPRPTVPPRPWNRRRRTPCGPGDVDEAGLGLRQRPVGGHVATVLVRVRVADHHLLATAAAGDEGGVPRVVEQRGEDLVAAVEVGDRLEQGHDVDRARRRLAGAHEPALAQQHGDLEHVAGRRRRRR